MSVDETGEPTLDPELLQILACPDCRGGVRQDGDTLRCQQCARSYPVRGVPVMLVEESTPGA